MSNRKKKRYTNVEFALANIGLFRAYCGRKFKNVDFEDETLLCDFRGYFKKQYLGKAPPVSVRTIQKGRNAGKRTSRHDLSSSRLMYPGSFESAR